MKQYQSIQDPNGNKMIDQLKADRTKHLTRLFSGEVE